MTFHDRSQITTKAKWRVCLAAKILRGMRWGSGYANISSLNLDDGTYTTLCRIEGRARGPKIYVRSCKGRLQGTRWTGGFTFSQNPSKKCRRFRNQEELPRVCPPFAAHTFKRRGVCLNACSVSPIHSVLWMRKSGIFKSDCQAEPFGTSSRRSYMVV